MGLMLVQLTALLALTAAVTGAAALRSGVTAGKDPAGDRAESTARRRRYLAEATGAHPPHRVR